MHAFRWVYVIVSFIFVGFTFAQFYTAGMAIFESGVHWANHSMLVKLLGSTLPILMLITALIGKLGKWIYLHILSIYVLIILMYATSNLGFEFSFLGSLHPVIGVLLFVLSASNVLLSIKLTRK
ncbi:DUF6220 domain-containing protein [Salicibibacter kimchii]|uniref:Uncharacterized protein n=1 Tax=Salicibibacter kimchii TaxID=2099786 RepID=A0A345C2F5_9BACI|nr:hypothetical protein DT065_16225 [Salicibibacter kimchii]